MKCCPHIEALYKKKPNQVESVNFDHVEKLFKLVVELNHQYFGSNKTTVNNNSTDEIACIKCSSCDRMSRLYMCAHCFVICCHSHAEQHARLKSHPLAVEITYATIYCHVCKDFQYNQDLEEFVCQLFLKENFLPFGKFNEWQPSQKNLDLLKKNYNLQQQQQHPPPQPLTIAAAAAAAATIPQQQQKLTFKLKTSSIIGLRGLINLGNTCFMNCILQTLTHIPSLRDYFLGDQHYCSHPNSAYKHHLSDDITPASSSSSSLSYNNNGSKNLCLVCELVTLFHEFYSGKRSPYIPYTLLHQVWTQVKHLAGYEQQDAHEFFIAALNSIHKNCIENDQICINLNKNRKHFRNYNNCNCIIDQIFTGGLQSDVICSNCNHISTTVDPFWDISLDIYKNTNKSSVKSVANDDHVLKLEDCLLKFTLPEILTSFNCSKCKCSREARKQFTMKKLPIVCCFHLKRFEQSNRIHKKIFDHISFPEILDMSPFMSSNQGNNKDSNTNNNNNNNNNSNNNINSDNNSNNSNEEDSTNSSSSTNPVVENSNNNVERTKLGSGKFDSNKYFLFAVVNHYGTLESGHYTSFIRLKKDQWYKCDDHVISRATLNEVMSSEGYLLFYHKLWNNFE